MTDYFGLPPDGYQKPLYLANNLSDVVDKVAARANLGVASSDDVLKAANPIGTILAFYGNTAPYGYLPCSGQTISSATFPSLVAFLGGTTSATVPDLRGEFLRGWDNSRGVDPARLLGSSQAASIVGVGDATKTSAFTVSLYNSKDDDATSYINRLNGDGVPDSTALGTTQVSASTSSGLSSAVGCAMYVRPRNVSVLYCIKAYDTPVSASNLSVTALANELPLKVNSSEFTGANQLKAANGYQKLPGGTILQWGSADGTASDSEILTTFPVAFSSTPIVSVTWGNSSASLVNSSISSQTRLVTSTNFLARREDIGSYTGTVPTGYLHWIAIGY